MIVMRAEYAAGDHVLTRYLVSDLTQIPFSDGAMISIIYPGSSEEPCGFAVNEANGVIVVDVPTPSGVVTRMSKQFGDPGTWITVG
jgi:hypothetical protein